MLPWREHRRWSRVGIGIVVGVPLVLLALSPAPLVAWALGVGWMIGTQVANAILLALPCPRCGHSGAVVRRHRTCPSCGQVTWAPLIIGPIP